MKELFRWVLLPLSFAMLLAAPVAAKEKPEWRSWPTGDRIYATVSWFKPKLDTQATISDSAGNLGATINFESTLGLADSKSTVLAGVKWRISKRNALAFDYFTLDRSAAKNGGATINIGDRTFTPDLNLPIASYFDIEAYNLLYSFSAIANRKMDLTLGVGLSLQNLSFGISQTEDCVFKPCNRTAEVFAYTAPLPTLNLGYNYAFSDKWIGRLNLGWLAVSANLDTNEDVSGQIWNATAGVRWKTWKHVGFNLGYNYFDVDIEYEKRKLRADVIYKYNGFSLGIDGYF